MKNRHRAWTWKFCLQFRLGKRFHRPWRFNWEETWSPQRLSVVFSGFVFSSSPIICSRCPLLPALFSAPPPIRERSSDNRQLEQISMEPLGFPGYFLHCLISEKLFLCLGVLTDNLKLLFFFSFFLWQKPELPTIS